MNARTRDRGDVDHRAFGVSKLVNETARQHDRGIEIDLEDRLPVFFCGLDRIEPGAVALLGRDRGIVDERVEARALRLQALLDLGDRIPDRLRVTKIGLDVIFRTRIPGAVLRKGMARYRDRAP